MIIGHGFSRIVDFHGMIPRKIREKRKRKEKHIDYLRSITGKKIFTISQIRVI